MIPYCSHGHLQLQQETFEVGACMEEVLEGFNYLHASAYPPFPIYEALASLSTSHCRIAVSQASEKLKCKQINDVGSVGDFAQQARWWRKPCIQKSRLSGVSEPAECWVTHLSSE